MNFNHNKTRVAIFGSYYRGAAIIHELHYGPLSRHIEIVGVVTDSPPPFERVQCEQNHFYGRIWKHLFERGEKEYERARLMVPKLVEELNIDRFCGRIRVPDEVSSDGKATEHVDEPSPRFWQTLTQDWKPDIILSATFGQRIPTEVAKQPRLKCFNFHPSTYAWPSPYKGGNPYEKLLERNRKFFLVTMHEVVWEFDAGPVVSRSGRIPIPSGTTPLELYVLSTIPTVQLAISEVENIIQMNPP